VSDTQTLYDEVGGQAFFDALVDGFYRRVEDDPVLLRLYPDTDDLGGARWRLATFLGQYWGGPTAYSDERGHPRLRMRHAPYTIGPEERDHWLAAMRASIDDLDPPAEVRGPLDEYLAYAAEAMRNHD
jgi:hemoglobin